MGILKPKKPPTSQLAPVATKRKSVQAGIENLKPLKPSGNVASFNQVRDPQSPVDKNGKAKSPDDMDSDDDIKGDDNLNDADDEEVRNDALSPEDATKQGEISEGVRKMHVCTMRLSRP